MNKNSGVQATTKGQVYLNESGILIQAYHDNIDLLLDDAREEFALYSKLCKSIKRPLLVDIRNIRSVFMQRLWLFIHNCVHNCLLIVTLER